MIDKLIDELDAIQWKTITRRGQQKTYDLLRKIVRGPVSKTEVQGYGKSVIMTARTFLYNNGYPYTIRQDGEHYKLCLRKVKST